MTVMHACIINVWGCVEIIQCIFPTSELAGSIRENSLVHLRSMANTLVESTL